jgi:hypothetical protein
MSKISNQIRKAETEVKEIEMSIMYHEMALRHKGFIKLSGLMSREELAEARNRRSSLKEFINDSRKNSRQNEK